MQHQSLHSHIVVGAVQHVVLGQPVVLKPQHVRISWLWLDLLRAMSHGHPMALSSRSKIQTNGGQLVNQRKANSLKLLS